MHAAMTWLRWGAPADVLGGGFDARSRSATPRRATLRCPVLRSVGGVAPPVGDPSRGGALPSSPPPLCAR